MHLGLDLVRCGAKGLQHASCHTLALPDQAQQNVLCADVVVTCKEVKLLSAAAQLPNMPLNMTLGWEDHNAHAMRRKEHHMY